MIDERMMNVILLTKSGDGKSICVAPDLIVSIEVVDDVTMLNVRSDRIFVKESPEVVTHKVLNYKLAVIRYESKLIHPTKAADEILVLMKLAGLEGQL